MRPGDLPYDAVVATPLPDGLRLGVRCGRDAVTAVDFLPADTPCRAPRGAVAEAAVRQLADYFSGASLVFTLAPTPRGTPFQRRVWQALRAIPPGRVVTYGALARRLGSGARAVANACRANPIPLIVPCHRVVAAGGVGGFMGATAGAPIMVKQWLLQYETR